MTEYMQVPVPVEHVLEVYEFLARRSKTKADSVPDAEQDPRLPQGWTAPDVVRMYRESPSSMQGILAYLAQRPGKATPSTTLAEEIRYRRPQFAGTLGAFGRRVKNRYSKDTWPIETSFRSDRGEWEYKMSIGVAELVREEIAGQRSDGSSGAHGEE